jgi:hypothetical protein
LLTKIHSALNSLGSNIFAHKEIRFPILAINSSPDQQRFSKKLSKVGALFLHSLHSGFVYFIYNPLMCVIALHEREHLIATFALAADDLNAKFPV